MSESNENETIERAEDLVQWTRRYVELDESIRSLELQIKPTRNRIKELKTQRKNLSECIIGVLNENDVSAMQINQNGARISVVTTEKKKPTLRAIMTTMEQELFKDNPESFTAFQQKALSLCENRVSSRLVFRRGKQN